MSSSALVLVGAVNWDHPAWRGRFYPEGLPDDWMLSYYNTQFQAVYLTADRWQGTSATTWSRWLDDTQEGFHFVLEPAASAVPAPVSPRVTRADAAWEAAHVWWLDEQPDLRALAERIARHAAQGQPLFVFSRRADLGRLEQIKSLKEVTGY